MGWTLLAGYVGRSTTDAIKSPTTVAFGAVFLAFFAGAKFGYRLGSPTSHSSLLGGLDWLLIALFLMLALDRGYFLIRAIHKLEDTRKSILPS